MASHVGDLQAPGEGTCGVGSRFNIKDFHNVILSAGTVPLTILQNEVEAYTRSKQASPN